MQNRLETRDARATELQTNHQQSRVQVSSIQHERTRTVFMLIRPTRIQVMPSNEYTPSAV